MNLYVLKATQQESESDFQRKVNTAKQAAEDHGGTTELVEMPWTVGDCQFRSVRMHHSFADGAWSIEHRAFCSKDGISMFIDINNAPDDWTIDDVMSRFQPLAAPEGA